MKNSKIQENKFNPSNNNSKKNLNPKYLIITHNFRIFKAIIAILCSNLIKFHFIIIIAKYSILQI